MKPPPGWFSISEHWDRIVAEGEIRDRQKSNYKTARKWCAYGTNFVGLCAEVAIGMLIEQEVDWKTRISGDGGSDFTVENQRWNVKGTPFCGKNPKIMVQPDKVGGCDYFVLVQVSIDHKLAHVVGWATAEQVRSAPLKRHGFKPTLTISRDWMFRNGQEGLPSGEAA